MNKNIFKYHNGERDVYGDPLVLRDRIFAVSEGQFWNLRKKVSAITNADAQTPEGILAIQEGIIARGHLVTIACGVFGLPPFDENTGAGMVAEDCLAVTEAFITFLNQKKTTAEQPPTTSPSTDGTLPASVEPMPTTSASS